MTPRDATAVAAAADGTRAAPDRAAADRLAWLFRRSLRQGRLHPLLHILQAHRHAQGPLDHAAPPAPADNPWLVGAPVDLADVRRHIARLPAMPRVVHELQALLHRDTSHAADIAVHVEHDQALSARTLQLANSAFYGVSGRVGSVREAVQVLGLETVGALLTLSAVRGTFTPDGCEGFDADGFWKHALATALMSRHVAQALPGAQALSSDEAFAAGLLHDIGLLLLATHFKSELATAIDHSLRTDMPLHEAEQLIMGCSHTQIGALLAGHWHFNGALADAIAHHHRPAARAWNEAASITDVVHAAHATVHAMDLEGHAQEQVPPVDTQAWLRLGLPDSRWLQLLDEADVELTQLCGELGL